MHTRTLTHTRTHTQTHTTKQLHLHSHSYTHAPAIYTHLHSPDLLLLVRAGASAVPSGGQERHCGGPVVLLLLIAQYISVYNLQSFQVNAPFILTLPCDSYNIPSCAV